MFHVLATPESDMANYLEGTKHRSAVAKLTSQLLFCFLLLCSFINYIIICANNYLLQEEKEHLI